MEILSIKDFQQLYQGLKIFRGLDIYPQLVSMVIDGKWVDGEHSSQPIKQLSRLSESKSRK